MVPFRSQVLQEHWGTIVCGDQYIERAVVIEVSDGQPTRSKAFVKNGTCGRADDFQNLSVVVIKQQGLSIRHMARMFLDSVIGMAIGHEEINVSVIVPSCQTGQVWNRKKSRVVSSSAASTCNALSSGENTLFKFSSFGF